MSEMKTTQDRLGRDPSGSGYPGSAPSPSVSASGGYPSREVEHPVWALCKWLMAEYPERDPTNGEAYDRTARPLVSALIDFERLFVTLGGKGLRCAPQPPTREGSRMGCRTSRFEEVGEARNPGNSG